METVKKCRDYIFRTVKLNSSLVAVVLGVCLGLIIKFFVPLTKYSHIYMNFPALWHLRMLHVVTTPLVCTGVVLGVCDGKVDIPGRFGRNTSIYRAATTFLSVTLGLVLVMFIKPGDDARRIQEDEEFNLADSLMDVVLDIIPTNFILDTSRRHKTVRNVTHHIHGTNMLGLIAWACVVGTYMRLRPSHTRLRSVIVTFNKATTIIVNYILGFLPLGLVFMTTCLVVEAKDWELIFNYGKFIGVVVLGLIIHATLVLPLVYVLSVRRNPYVVIKGVFPALMTAFLSSSSSATLPLTFKCCEERLKIDKKFCRPILSIWTNTNINGSVIYEVVAAIFIAQLNHLHLDFSQLIVIAMVSAVPCLGGTGTPARGAATTFLNLTVAGLPGREACLLVVTQYLLDRCNTFLNVLGDCIGVALLHQVSERGLGAIESQRQSM